VYSFRTTFGPADLAFTDRYGGVSASPYDELNLAVAGADAPEAKAENLRRLREDFGPDDVVCDLYQVHGADVVLASPDRVERTQKLFRRGHSPDQVARAIVGAVERDRPLVPVGWESKLGWVAHRLGPLRLSDAVARAGGRWR